MIEYYTRGEYSKTSRVSFARASISRAKIDLIRLAELDPTVQYLVDQLETVQLEFRLKFAKQKGGVE